jgi:hypothetical protein
MLAEYPETDPLFVGADRLGRWLGKSGRWIRHQEAAGIVERAVLNGEGPRPVYSADEALPKLTTFMSARKSPSPETQALAAQRVEAGRLKLEAARLELDKLQGEVMPTAEAIRIFGDQIAKCRQRFIHLPGAVKTTLGLSMAQTLGLQKEIRAALTELRDQGKRAAGGQTATGKLVPQRRRRLKRRVKG